MVQYFKIFTFWLGNPLKMTLPWPLGVSENGDGSSTFKHASNQKSWGQFENLEHARVKTF